ncbi:hypothetical protein F53441_10313 [Fusarium austroafricanum]|uniref:Ribophorin II C-terminal domain-containing protein n=1 Tax=Fusarium austroafricanum TaxID=2364996 RepID=A0A8H4K920_9HYPO|nr:hypothetical protein F53441_10313 [Fusarium austroafricanum]
MRFSIASSLLFLTSVASAAPSWSFTDGSVTVGSKRAQSVTAKFSDQKPTKNAIVLGKSDTIRVSLTTTEAGEVKRPHQAFLILTESTGLEAPYPLSVKTSGKAQVDISQKDLPVQFQLSDEPIKANLVLGSFGSSNPLISPVFNLEVRLDPAAPAPQYEAPLRYGPRAEINHIFRVGDKSPPMVVTLVFVLAIVASVPALFLAWLFLGANVNHLPKALNAAPISHAVFFGSIVSIEGTLFLYYARWNLFHTLPVVIVLSVVSFLSGTKALSEVQSRRLAGER